MRLGSLVIPSLIVLTTALPHSASAQDCATAGKDGAGGVLSGVVNSYYPGAASVAAGATSLTLGARRGAATSITSADLLLLIQMQDAQINATSSTSYGDGVAGEPASGTTSTGSTGHYEFVRATNSIGSGGGTLNLASTGVGGGLRFAYSNAGAVSAQGARRFQVIRVPQYTSATLGNTLTAAAWDGSTGGVLALDVSDVLTLDAATVSVSGLGFRGGAGVALAGGAGSNTDIRSLSSATYHGGKGEGIAGSPRFMWNGSAVVDLGAVNTLPQGDRARGAPGNSGGGGTDGAPLSNTQNSGGGGGGNGGAGGQGGHTWSTQLAVGGCGGAAFADASAQRVIMGGGGGSGSRNSDGVSHGGVGGGIMFIRAHALSGTAKLQARGTFANTVNDDGGGGGGAGGSVVVAVRSGSLSGLTVDVRGGEGGDSNTAQQDAGPVPGNRFGPGGGGGGGVAILTDATASVLVAGGAAGTTCRDGGVYGATAGSSGTQVTIADESVLPGISSGARCFNAPPLLVAPASQSLGADTVLTFSAAAGNAITLTDDDAGLLDLELRVLSSSGVATLASTAGLTVTGNGSSSIVATGSLARLAAALDGLEFRRPGATSGPGQLNVIANDLGHDGLSASSSDTVSVSLVWGTVDVPPSAGALLLAPVRPNPSRGPLHFEFVLPREGLAHLDVFDGAGRRVRSVAERRYSAGRTTLTWQPDDRSLAPGVYHVVLRTELGSRARSFVLLR